MFVHVGQGPIDNSDWVTNGELEVAVLSPLSATVSSICQVMKEKIGSLYRIVSKVLYTKWKQHAYFCVYFSGFLYTTSKKQSYYRAGQNGFEHDCVLGVMWEMNESLKRCSIPCNFGVYVKNWWFIRLHVDKILHEAQAPCAYLESCCSFWVMFQYPWKTMRSLRCVWTYIWLKVPDIGVEIM